MNEMNGRTGRNGPDGPRDLADPPQIDRIIDDVVARRQSGPRTARRPRPESPAADEQLVTALAGLTVIDWPADQASDRIARGVAVRAAGTPASWQGNGGPVAVSRPAPGCGSRPAPVWPQWRCWS